MWKDKLSDVNISRQEVKRTKRRKNYFSAGRKIISVSFTMC